MMIGELKMTGNDGADIGFEKQETVRASMRKMVKWLLKKYKYPSDKYEDAVETVMNQYELWTDSMEV